MRLLVFAHILHFCFATVLIAFSIGCGSDYSSDPHILTSLPDHIDFNFHVKPILSDRCFSCHGPDEAAREGNVRLDLKEHAFAAIDEDGKRFAIVPGNLRKSELIQRITHHDPADIMPPPESNRSLSAYEIEILKRWVKQGAEYKAHWAFIPPAKTDIPVLENDKWCRNSIDHFILKKREEKELDPKAEAEKEILLRRVTLDLTGLPPTLEEIDNFLKDDSPNAFSTVVDRLLDSPHFGERLSLFWLDLARYADSHGYSQDGLRIMWPWRDWVIKAFNENMPYDQFLAWQLAGDQFPDARQEQKLATAFLRNHRLNGEGGIVDEEYRIEYAADRTETAATAFLGLTMQCARCHDHKFDPISQEEYYQFFSFFNSVHEAGKAANDGNSGPELLLTSNEVAEQIDAIERMIQAQEEKAQQLSEHLPDDAWQQPKLNLSQGLVIDLSFDKMLKEGFQNEIAPWVVFYGSGDIEQVAGIRGKAIAFTAFDYINLVSKDLNFDRADACSFSFYLKMNQDISFTSVLNHLGSPTINYPGYEVAIIEGYPTLRLAHSLPANLIEVRGTKTVSKGEWEHFMFTYDGSGKASGIDLFRNGEKEATSIVYDKLTQGFANGKKSLTIGGQISYQTEVDGFGFIDELKIYDRQLSAIEANALFHQASVPIETYSEELRQQHFLLNQSPVYKKIQDSIQQLRREMYHIQDTLVSVMVMEDLPQPRRTFILNRGVYDAPEKEVFPNTPQAIPPFPSDTVSDRLALANWMLDRRNPLTARVAVNRFWQLLFGQGIVKTSENFGNQGALPSHPELLDFLATSFVESGWDMKALLKMMVMSSTYRQSSRTSADERAKDPDNIFLARGPSRRLSAELIRDCALAASGLLVRKIGGPSVKPYQPEGLWKEKGEFSKLKNYTQDIGDKLYRRSLYTFWRRTSPPPSMITFDAPTRDICIVSRQETNTPLQALVLLNDPQFVESARVLAERVMLAVPNARDQLIMAHRLLTGLHPTSDIVEVLLELHERESEKFASQSEMAQDLLEAGEYPVDTSLRMTKVAAMTIVCSTIMSFDETLIKR